MSNLRDDLAGLQAKLQAIHRREKKATAHGRPASGCSLRGLAEQIATRLYTDGSGQEATRLELRLATTPNRGRSFERPLGGWCKGAATDQILAILEENATGQPPATGSAGTNHHQPE